MVIGNQFGNNIISGGIIGTPSQFHCPNKASQILVNTRVFGTPPLDKMNLRAAARGSVR